MSDTTQEDTEAAAVWEPGYDIGPVPPDHWTCWTCERCNAHHDHSETYYSAHYTNETGTDLVLCQPCAVTAEDEHEAAAVWERLTVTLRGELRDLPAAGQERVHVGGTRMRRAKRLAALGLALILPDEHGYWWARRSTTGERVAAHGRKAGAK